MSSELTLFHLFPSRSCRVLWLLKELEIPVKVITKDFLGDPNILNEPEFLKVNPTGKLPALVDGDVVVVESGAIVLYVLEKLAGGKLQPKHDDAKGRALLYQYAFQGETEVSGPAADYFWNAIQFPEEKRRPQVAERGKIFAMKGLDVLEKDLEGKEYLINNEFGAADIIFGYSEKFAEILEWLDPHKYPNVTKHLGRLKERPAFKATFQPNST